MNETIKCKAVFVDMLGITGDGWFPFLPNLLGRTLCLKLKWESAETLLD